MKLVDSKYLAWVLNLSLFCVWYSPLIFAEESSPNNTANSAAYQPMSSSQENLSVAPTAASTETKEPFAFADFTWLNGNSRQTVFPLETKYFTGQFIFDSNYISSFNTPQDHTLVGSTNSGRTEEFQVQQLGVGGDFHYYNFRGRLMTQIGMYSVMTPRNDPTPSRGQWNLWDAYRYVSEAYGGYHWDVWNGINLDFGIFLSYIGLCSYYNYENWIYQMSYVSANTPFFFNGMRLQVFPTDRFKAELWLTNGWQSYGMYNDAPGVGISLQWRPTGSLYFVTNDYFTGHDTLGNSSRIRYHSDNSFQMKYHDNPSQFLSKAAFSLTLDAGCEDGGGVSCTGSDPSNPAQYFLGFMLYNRLWFLKDHFALTLGAGAIQNPGRYLVLLPPINGATAASSTPYFTQNPGDPFTAWDSSITFDYLPSESLTFRLEFIHRQASVPYFAGHGGVTPLVGGNFTNQGSPGSIVPGFQPDLVNSENRINSALLIRL